MQRSATESTSKGVAESMLPESRARSEQEAGRAVESDGFPEETPESQEVTRQLQESEQRYRSLFENNVDVVVTFGLEGKFLQMNRATEQLLGIPAKELVGTPFLQMIVPERRAHSEREFFRVLEGTPVQYQTAVYNRRR